MSRLLTRVHVSGPTSRAALTRETGLNRSTIGDLAGELEELGLVTPGDPVVAGRSGRPSPLVVPRRENAVVAVDLGVDRIAVALVGLGGDVLERRERRHARGEHDVQHVVESLVQMVEDVLAGREQVRCLGLGASVPGAIRARDGMVRFAPNLGWVDEPFTDLLGARLDMPVTTGNDANLGALAEHVRGAAVGFSEVAYLSGSVGIGGGFLVNGEPMGGAHGYAGEIGHLLVDSNGPACRCGNIGCWEMKIGENQILTQSGRLPGGGPRAVAEVIAAAAAGEERAATVLANVAEWVGVGLRGLSNIFNPEVVVLGGSLAEVWEAELDHINEVLDRTRLISPHGEVLIRPAALGQDSSLLGAAEMAFAPLLADPQGVLSSDRYALAR
jgi:predicted NBD/HSP70 family sugar kinase